MEPGKLQPAAQGVYPAAWSFTGPPPGMAAQPQPVNFYQPYPPGGLVAMPPQPHMGIALHQTMPHMQPHPPPPHWMGAMAQPFPMNPVASVCPAAHHQMERKYANKKERDRAKKERKEARKLAENPLQPMTEDARPRAFLSDGERVETLQWIEDRKARFPTRERIANAEEQAEALSQAGGSGKGQSACDSRLFAVLQEQHRLGLLRSAGTEDLYRSFGSQGAGRGMGSKRGRGKGRGRGQAQHGRPAQTAMQTDPQAAAQAVVQAPSTEAAPNKDPTLNNCEGASLPCPDKEADAGATQSGAVEYNGSCAPMVHEPDNRVKVEISAATAADVENAPVNVSITVSSHVMPEAVAHAVEAVQQVDQVAATQQTTNKRKISDTCAPASHAGPKKAPKGGWQRADLQAARGASKPCLLHRLLAADVRQDRSLLLQAFRFFVENDFLQSVHATPLKFPDTAQ